MCYHIEIFFSIVCAFLIHTENTRIIQSMKRLRDDAIEAGEAKLSFIAKMRQEHLSFVRSFVLTL